MAKCSGKRVSLFLITSFIINDVANWKKMDTSVDLSSVTVVTVMFFKKGALTPVHKMWIDLLMDQDINDLNTFTKKIMSEGTETTRKELGLMKCQWQLGYCRKEGTKLVEFRPSHSQQQWVIALTKVKTYPDKYAITGET